MDKAMTEEQQLFLRYQETNDPALLSNIMEHYNYITEILAKRFSGKGLEYDDVYQSASIGLMNAIKRFDTKRGIRFATYATPTVLGEIKRLFRDKGNCIRVPRRMYEIFSKATKLRNEELIQTGKIPSQQELSLALDISEEQLAQAMYWGDTHEIRSLEQPLDDSDVLLSDCIGVEDNEFLIIENKDFIHGFMHSLPERERQFIRYRYYEELTQAKIAELMHTSQMNISRLEKKVLEHLRQLYQRTIVNA